MCGRARLSSDVSEIKIAFGIPPERPTPHVAASWNVVPTDPLPIVRYDAKDEGVSQVLIPCWIFPPRDRAMEEECSRRVCLLHIPHRVVNQHL